MENKKWYTDALMINRDPNWYYAIDASSKESCIGSLNSYFSFSDGAITDMDILFALTTDRMYKNKLKENDLDGFSEEEIAEMKKICAKRTEEIQSLYKIAYDICK